MPTSEKPSWYLVVNSLIGFKLVSEGVDALAGSTFIGIFCADFWP